jgi:hypothetical protein
MKIVFAGLVLAFGGAQAVAATSPQPQFVIVTLKDHRFVPDTITVPARVRVRIDITNRGATADDFDSDDLHVDKDLAPHGRASFIIGPLKPGSYAFKGDHHAATARGVVIAADADK